MHDIEPYHRWRDHYIANEDHRSPFFGRVYNEFQFTQKVYNYFIHPQWDSFGSKTLYCKLLFAQYDSQLAVIEMIGEWNDCLYNDIMYFKRKVVEPLIQEGICKFVLLCDNVLSFHGSEDDYYAEWYEECAAEYGWIVFVNTLKHVEEELYDTRLQHYVIFGDRYNDAPWRTLNPNSLCAWIEQRLAGNSLA